MHREKWPKRAMPARWPSAWSRAAAEHEADVLDGVVVVDLGVAAGLDGEAERAVAGQGLEHVRQEGHGGVDLRRARGLGAGQGEAHGDLGLAGAPLDERLAGRGREDGRVGHGG
jgi:hypothetical protein